MKRIWIVPALLLAARIASAEPPADLLAQARGAYDRGDYAAAAAAYQSMAEQGVASAELYYNLGNAQFKTGHLGYAIAAYRRALQRKPGDEDIRFNLAFARGYVRQPADRSGLLARVVGEWLTRVKGETLALAALALFWVLSALAGALILTRGRPQALRWATAAAGVLFVLAAGWASGRILLDRERHWGVVVAARAEARNGPSEEYQVGFIVPEGREVRVLGREGAWTAVGLPAEGYKGWVRRDEIIEDE